MIWGLKTWNKKVFLAQGSQASVLPVLVAEKGLIIFYKLLFFFLLHYSSTVRPSGLQYWQKKSLKDVLLWKPTWFLLVSGSDRFRVLGTKSAALAEPGLCNQWLRCSIKTHYWIVCTENSPSSPNDCLFKDHLNDYVCIIKDSFFVLSLPQLCDSRCYWATPENHCLAAGLSSHAKLLKPV